MGAMGICLESKRARCPCRRPCGKILLRGTKSAIYLNLSWVQDFYVRHPDLYASTIEKPLWSEGERTARAILQLLKEKTKRREWNILDVPCGMGRVAIPLAKLGARVTGVDLSPSYVAIARERAIRARVQRYARFFVGRAEEADRMFDQKSPLNEFDAAISIHTILGYGSRIADKAFLSATRRDVKAGGLFFITARRNTENILRHFEEASFQETGKMIILQNNNYVAASSRLYTTWRFYRKTKLGSLKFLRKFRTSLRLYSNEEITRLLEESGWKVIEFTGSLFKRREPLSEASPSIFVLARAA